MNRQFVTETSLAGLRPLGVSGRWVVESWHEIDAAIRTYLEPADARLLAEPVMGEGGIAWFAETEGEVVAHADLGPEAAAALVAETARRVERLQRLAADLLKDKAPATRRLGETLERALSVPSPIESRGFLYAILAIEAANQERTAIEPVLVSWGTRDDTPDAPTGVLETFLQVTGALSKATATTRHEENPTAPIENLSDAQDQRLVPAATPPAGGSAERQASGDKPAAVAGSDTVSGAPGLLWLLLGLLVAATFYLLLPACSVWTPFGTLLRACGTSAIEADRDLAAAKHRGDDLEARLADLERDMAALPVCEVALPAGGAAQVERLDQDVHAAGGAVGEVALTLSWDGDADLDLAVACPNGARISFLLEEMTQPACADGTLDVDANAHSVVSHPLENITWPRTPDRGRYHALVSNYAGRSSGARPVPYQLRVKNRGEQVMIEGAVAPDDAPESHLFDVR